jgi:hypothetical protein
MNDADLQHDLGKLEALANEMLKRIAKLRADHPAPELSAIGTRRGDYR